jgi:hypothetical protein
LVPKLPAIRPFRLANFLVFYMAVILRHRER